MEYSKRNKRVVVSDDVTSWLALPFELELIYMYQFFYGLKLILLELR